MALSDPYATVAEYQAVVGSQDAGSNAAIESDLKAVSRWLDRRLGRFFNKDASAVARVYIVPRARTAPPMDWAESENPFRWGNVYRTLEVDDVADTNGLVIKIDDDANGNFDETALNTTDYELQPLNAPLGPEARPYERIGIPSWSTAGGWRSGARVQVTAIFGWPAVPAAIKRATIDITSTMRTGSSRAEQAAGGVRSIAVSGGLSVTYGGVTDSATSKHEDMVQSLIREYGRARRFL